MISQSLECLLLKLVLHVQTIRYLKVKQHNQQKKDNKQCVLPIHSSRRVYSRTSELKKEVSLDAESLEYKLEVKFDKLKI